MCIGLLRGYRFEWKIVEDLSQAWCLFAAAAALQFNTVQASSAAVQCVCVQDLSPRRAVQMFRTFACTFESANSNVRSRRAWKAYKMRPGGGKRGHDVSFGLPRGARACLELDLQTTRSGGQCGERTNERMRENLRSVVRRRRARTNSILGQWAARRAPKGNTRERRAVWLRLIVFCNKSLVKNLPRKNLRPSESILFATQT